MKSYEAAVSTTEQEPASSTERQDAIRSGVARYGRLILRLNELYTGDPQKDFSSECETELFQQMRDGEEATERLKTIKNKLRRSRGKNAELLKIGQQSASGQVDRGAEARQKIIESNLRFAHFMARASMGIVNHRTSTIQRWREEDEAFIQKTGRRRKGKKRTVGTYSDITNLASPHAELEDRMQNAAIGLIEAVPKYDHTKEPTDSQSKAKFITYAAWHIQQAIDRYRDDDEIRETSGPRLPTHIHEEIRSKRKTYDIDDLSQAVRLYGDTMTDEERERLLLLHQWSYAANHLSLADVTYPHAAQEEIWNTDWEEPPTLSVAEVWNNPDEKDPSVLAENEALGDVIGEVLETLSEREAGVIRLRFGIGVDRPYTLDEIGTVYGLTRERIRQIEGKATAKLRHPDRSSVLRDFLDPHTLDNAYTNIYSGQLRISRTQAVPAAKKVEDQPDEESEAQRVSNTQESWQVTADEEWDTPVRDLPVEMARLERGTEEYQQVYQAFVKAMLSAPYNFQKSFGRAMGNTYPIGLYRDIESRIGQWLTPQHIEDFWNNEIPPFLDKLNGASYNDISIDRIGQLISMLLADHMSSEDAVTLHVPKEAQSKCGYLGAWARQGELTIIGEAGDYVGTKMTQTAQINVIGSVGNYAAYDARGAAQLKIRGDAGEYLACKVSGEVTIEVDGHVGQHTALGLKGDARVIINGEVQQAKDNAELPKASQPSLSPFEMASIKLGLTPQALERYTTAYGYTGRPDLNQEAIDALTRHYPELQVPPLPSEGYTPLRDATAMLDFKGSDRAFTKHLNRLGIPIYTFKNADGMIGVYLSNDNL